MKITIDKLLDKLCNFLATPSFTKLGETAENLKKEIFKAWPFNILIQVMERENNGN